MSGGIATYVEDLEQDPFDAMDLVERVAWRMTGGDGAAIDPLLLKEKFEHEISSLQMLVEQFSSKIGVLEQQLNAEKREFVQQLQRLHEQNTEAVDKIKQLDSTMQSVSGKVVHLGDQLEAADAPRARAHDALQLIQHFDEFLSDQPLNSTVFTDPDKLLESADLIQKLYSISQELSKDKFANVQARIAHRYDEVERLLIDEFARAGTQRDEKKMAHVARILSEFKGYSQCVDRYVLFLQANSFHRERSDVWADTLQLVRSARPRIQAIFPAPHTVVQKLLLNVFTEKIRDTVMSRLRDCREAKDQGESYLASLAQMYSSTVKLCGELEPLHVSADSAFLPTLTRAVFDRYINKYQEDELDFLHKRCAENLAAFYREKNHVKKQIQQGGLSELKRDVQARLLSVETHGGETFLSEELAINMLQDTRNAFARVALLCDGGESAAAAAEAVVDVLLEYVWKQHLDYAVELAISGISLAEQRTEPPTYFWQVVAQQTSIVLLLVKQYDDSVRPLVKGTLCEQSSNKKWTAAMRQIEAKINLGMERQLNAAIGYCRWVLSSEQKKTTFLQDGDIDIRVSQACRSVCACIRAQSAAMCAGVDGANLRALQTDVAHRIYKMLLAHIQQFVYNSAGAMLLICDINEYRGCISAWRNREASRPFDHLHALANLLGVLPDNLADSAMSEQLADVDRSLILQFLQLRQDYKSLRINLNVY